MTGSLRALYYQIKPLLPWHVRLALRRTRAKRRRVRFASSWPISERAGNPPAGWKGWPDAKKFALVLTHDVEGNEGVLNCRKLLELEKKLGFRSCFNFVPEGDYVVPKELRQKIVAQDFEVGVHDLKHDGKLYRFQRRFKRHAKTINYYLREWNAVGFRSAFMLHRPMWLHELNVLYDSSTFDTDPFEPQPDGVDTIYPFWVPSGDGRGYVELPYTLVQDYNLFIVLQEKGPEIWKKKLDWIAQRGGMVLLDSHPDYMSFENDRLNSRTYPAAYYHEFLNYITEKYQGQFWHPLPRELAAYVSGSAKTEKASSAEPVPRALAPPPSERTIWIDLDNTPHVPFFKPIIAELKTRGYQVLVTARDAFQVCELANFHRMEYLKIGRHYGKNKFAKIAGLFYRAFQLFPVALRERPRLALSHGSRSQTIACNLLRIPTVVIADYEHAAALPLMHPRWELVPEAIPDHLIKCRHDGIRKYTGIKEDVYAWTLTPDDSICEELSIRPDHIVALVRPPATEAHYHNPESEILFARIMERLCATPKVRVILLPRNRRQEEWVRSRWPQWFQQDCVIVPQKAVDGLNLIWHADLVISGGGTMNRESAALGVPVYSIFRGPTGAVDRHLQAEGRLTLVSSTEEVDAKILIRKRENKGHLSNVPGQALRDIIAHIESLFALVEAKRGA